MVLRPLLCALAAAALLGAAPAGAAAALPGGARAALTSCQRGAEPADRAGVFTGSMRRVAGTARMQMRFTLQARTPDRPHWTAVTAAGFGTWASAAPGVSRYAYTKRVEGLLAPASYRVGVRFRWLDASGDVLAHTHAVSGMCRQPDPRANLVVRSIGVEAAPNPARRRYVVLVRNTGRSHAEPTLLTLSIDGVAQPAADVPDLAAGEGTLVTLTAPACAAGAELTAEADSGQAIDEADEADNLLSRPCPASG
jgi:hypothetical protein